MFRRSSPRSRGERDAETAYSPRLSRRSLRLRGEVLTSPAVLISRRCINQNGKLFFYASQESASGLNLMSRPASVLAGPGEKYFKSFRPDSLNR